MHHQIQLPPAKRYLARKVIVDGVERGLSLVEVGDDRVSVVPFSGETHSTAMVDGTLSVDTVSGKITLI